MKKALIISLKFLVFVVGLALVIINQKTVGFKNLLLMILGLAILISLVYSYNEQFK